jgi:hypothetical protein
MTWYVDDDICKAERDVILYTLLTGKFGDCTADISAVLYKLSTLGYTVL